MDAAAIGAMRSGNMRARWAIAPAIARDGLGFTRLAGLEGILHGVASMNAGRTLLVAASAWWSRHRRRWRRRHLHAVSGGAPRPFGDRAMRLPRERPETPTFLRMIDPPARRPEPHWRKLRSRDTGSRTA